MGVMCVDQFGYTSLFWEKDSDWDLAFMQSFLVPVRSGLGVNKEVRLQWMTFSWTFPILHTMQYKKYRFWNKTALALNTNS